ncbi:hypothetical protein ACFQ1S_20585 [Kibdelosporangium lantanae]|uniref:Uncharacterized protein n=1 Tax=Kibdelosporangium lantanae TaxID=1497396 RepID=A0ABW3MB37_9PSEU
MTAMTIAPAALGSWHGEIWLTDQVLTDPHAYLDRVQEYPRTHLWPVLVPRDGLGIPPEVVPHTETVKELLTRNGTGTAPASLQPFTSYLHQR